MDAVGFSDTVRGLAAMSDLGILSASHDGWDPLLFVYYIFTELVFYFVDINFLPQPLDFFQIIS